VNHRIFERTWRLPVSWEACLSERRFNPRAPVARRWGPAQAVPENQWRTRRALPLRSNICLASGAPGLSGL
jgi:hypothetical protein